MPDTIGNITVPEVATSGTFPLEIRYGMVTVLEPRVIVHTFGAGNAKREQRVYQGNPDLRRFLIDQEIWDDEREPLRTFYEARQGSYQPFTVNIPLEDGTTEAVTCIFEDEPFGWEFTGDQTSRVRVTLVEVATGAGESHALTDSLTISDIGKWKRDGRPGAELPALFTDELLEQAQTLIPLIKIQPRAEDPENSGQPYPAIYLSDRRVTIGGQLYVPRVLWEKCGGIGQTAIGLPGGYDDSDDVTLVFGNADRVMRDLAEDVILDLARVEISAFHVESGIRVDIWAGEIQPGGWESNVGPEFAVQCSDILASPYMVAPVRNIDHKCPFLFDDGNDCPFTAQGTLDLVHFPSASGAECDRGYETPNGCLAHGMKRYYGGVFIHPQAVRVKDNGTGRWGFSRDVVNAVSLINDSNWGLPLPLIYTDTYMPVPVYVMAYRNEGDFRQGIGIVGQGPLFSYVRGKSTLDGRLNHKNFLPREVLGTHPAGASDFFSLEQSGNQTANPQNTPDWRNFFNGSSTYRDNFTAGLAFVVVRIFLEEGERGFDKPSKVEEHSMEAIVLSGLTGLQWTAPGSRNEFAGFTNPVWVALDVYLRALSLRNADTTSQEQYFDVHAAIYAAGICDEPVDKIVGAGTETQFKFIGRIDTVRPVRDHLSDILINCLGYYTMSFGKLKFGVRVNSSAVAAFTSGNMLWRSLRLSSHGREFNRCTMRFAEIQQDSVGDNTFIPMTATYQDDDQASELGGGVRSIFRTAEFNLPGTATRSQAQRIANTRGREEAGGVDAAQRRRARRASWSTTIAGIDTEAGDVVSVTDDEVPSGSGEFRILRWRLNPDWSIEIEGRSTTDEMYDLIAGPKPEDVIAGAVPPEQFPMPYQIWHPNAEAPDAADPVFDENDRTFILGQRYENREDGSQEAFFTIRGRLPINTYLPDTVPPIVRSGTAEIDGSAFLPADTPYFAAVCGYNAQGYSPPSNLMPVRTGEDAGTYKITFSGIQWPAGTFDGFVLFVAEGDERTICAQIEFEGALPDEIEFAGPWKRSTWNMPSTQSRRVIVKARRVVHSGVIGTQVDEVGPNTLRCGGLAGLGAGESTADDWTGRIVSVISDRSDYSSPPLNFEVTDYDDATGTFTVTPDPEALGVFALAVLVVRFKADTVTANSIGDSGLINGVSPGGATDDESGYMIWIIAGTGRGQIRRIQSNTETTYTIDEPWETQPDDTSIWVVCEAAWRYAADAPIPPVVLNNIDSEITVRGENLSNLVYMLAGFIEDRRGGENPDEMVTPREIWIYGGLGAITLTERLTFEWEGEVENPDTVDVPGPITIPDGQLAEIYEVWVTIADPPTGGAGITFDMKWSEDEGATFPDSIFTAPQVLPAGARELLITDFADDPMLIRRAFRLKPFVTGVGTGNPGSDMAIVVRYRLRVDPLQELAGMLAGGLDGSHEASAQGGTLPVGVAA